MAEFVNVSKTEDGTRLIRWFVRKFPSMPQREFYKLCRGGQIRVNSKRVRGTEVLQAGDAVRVPPTLAGYADVRVKKTESGDNFSLTDLESLRKCIIHNDDDIVVFNKPAGLAVQGGTGIRKSIDKMAAALFPYDKISLVHRLDRETSGVLVVAKNQRAAQVLADAFQSKTAHKEYLALLNGVVKPEQGLIDNFVFSLGAPIVGDALYGGRHGVGGMLQSVLATNNLFLFAYKITFQHPSTGRLMTLRATVPDFMVPVMKFLEFKLP